MDEKIQISLVVLLTGLVVVFAVLVMLILIIKIYGTIIHKMSQKNKPEPPKSNPTPPPAPKKAPVPAPVVEDGISEEIVAAIAAAIDCMYGSGTAQAVKSIKRAVKPVSRPAWGVAGLLENTRPF